MSAWRILLKSLYAKGGGPLPKSAFDSITTEAAGASAMRFVRMHGLIESRRLEKKWQFALTTKGVDWCEGRMCIGARAGPMQETAQAKADRIARLVADSDEAAEACAKLTDRQRAILVMSAKGFTFAEIGCRLGIKAGSAQEHSRRIFGVIGCGRTVEAAVIAAKAGLV